MGRYMMPAFVTMPPEYFLRDRRRCYPDPLEDLINSMYGRKDKCEKSCEPNGHCGTKEGRVPSPFQSFYRILVPRQPWVHLIDFSGYGPGELSTELKEGRFNVHARREIKLSEDDYELMERRRSVKIPEGVDASEISCYLRADGQLVISAPYLEEEALRINNDVSRQCFCEKEKKCKKLEKSDKPRIEQRKENVKIEADTKTCADQECPKPRDGEQTHVLSTCQKEPDTSDKEVELVEKSKAATEKIPTEQESKDENDEHKIILFLSPDFSDEFYVFEPGLLSEKSEKPEMTEVAETKETSTDPHVFPLADMVKVVETNDKKHFEVKVNLEGYQPQEVSVKCENGVLIIDCRRERETKGVKSSKTFHKRYALPEGAMCDQTKAVLKDTGMMEITVPIVERETGGAIRVPVMSAEK